MIIESYPWKKALLRDLEIMIRWAAKPTEAERKFELLEKKLFISAYAMRKLFNSAKLTSKLDHLNIRCQEYPRTKSHIDVLNKHRLEDHYFLNRGKRSQILAYRLLNEIIHSWIFSFVTDDDGRTTGFFVASDQNHKNRLLDISLQDFFKLMATVGNDDVLEAHFRRQEDGSFTSWRG